MGFPDIKIKFCGLQRPKDIDICAKADYLGFVVEVPEARRNISLEKASMLINSVKKSHSLAKTVAVTTSLGKIVKISTALNPDVIQIHADISRQKKLMESLFHDQIYLGQKFAFVLGVEDEKIVNKELLNGENFNHQLEYVVIEGSNNGKIQGGSGKSRDYCFAKSIIREHTDLPFIVGGGLTPTNVKAVVDSIHPFGIDVSSGIEGSDGYKSQKLVNELLQQLTVEN